MSNKPAFMHRAIEGGEKYRAKCNPPWGRNCDKIAMGKGVISSPSHRQAGSAGKIGAVRRRGRSLDEIKVMLSDAENPPMMPGSIGSLLELPGQWWAAHTKARCEKALAWDFIKHNVAYFLPMLEQVAIWGGRKRTVRKPLFSSYVFFCGDDQDRIKALASGRVCQTIPVPQRNAFVNELDALRRTLADNPMVAYPFAAVGKRCRVKCGPLEGIEGIVIRNQQSTQLVLQVSMLGQGASLQIEPELLEPAE